MTTPQETGGCEGKQSDFSKRSVDPSRRPGKTCRGCACQFKPRRPYYQFCDPCFAKRRAIEAERAYRRRFPDE